MANQSQDLTQGEVSSHLIHLAGFMLIGFVSVMGANLMETVYVGQVSTEALAALGFTFPVIMMLQGITMGLSLGASSVVSRSIGSDDWQRAKKLITHCLLLSMIFIALVIGTTWMALPALFELLGATGNIQNLAVQYMQIWLTGLPFFSVAMVGSTLMRATGDAKTPGLLMTIGSCLQIVIGPVFIFGWFGVPEFGLAGAALAFLVARFSSFLMYSWSMHRSQLLAWEMSGFFRSCRDILHVGLPAITSNLIGPVGMSVITRLLAGHGAVVVAGFGVASRVESMLMMIIFALSMSVSPLVGQNWGKKAYRRVKHTLRLANGFSLLWGITAYILLLFLGEKIVSMINNDPSVIEAAVWYLLIGPIAIGFLGVLQNSTSAFNALGKPLPPLLISILQMLILGIPAALLGNYLFGYPGIFAGIVVTSIILATGSWLWIRRTIATEIRADKLLRKQQLKSDSPNSP